MGYVVTLLASLFVGRPLLAAVAASGAPECRPLADPKRLPSLGSLVDSAGFVAALPPSIDTAGIQLGLAFPSAGGSIAVFVIEPSDSASQALARRVEALVVPHGVPGGTTIRIRIRSATDIRVERSILCPPVPVDSAVPKRLTMAMGRVSSQEELALLKWTPVIRMRIGIDGRVVDARLQPGSGRRDIDQQALEPVYQRRWRPATLDGRPVEVWFANDRVELVR